MIRRCDVCCVPLNVERRRVGRPGRNKVKGFNTSNSSLRSDDGVSFGSVWICNKCYEACLKKVEWGDIVD